MELFFKAIAMALITAIVTAELKKQDKDVAIVLSMAACAMVCAGALQTLRPVLNLLEQLQQVGQLDSSCLALLLKATGIALAAEIAASVCADGGSAALAQAIRLLAVASILCLSVPMLETLLTFVQEMVAGG